MNDEDTYLVDGLRCWKKFCHPLEKPKVAAIRLAYPDWEVLDGPYIPGKAGCSSYRIGKEGELKFVHVRDDDNTVTED